MTQNEPNAARKEPDFSQMKAQEVVKLLGSDLDTGKTQVKNQPLSVRGLFRVFF